MYVQDMGELQKEMALRRYRRQQQPPAYFTDLIAEMLAGGGGAIIVIPADWDEQINDLIRAARQAKQRQRVRELEALRELFALLSVAAVLPAARLHKLIRQMTVRSGEKRPTQVTSVILGSLGWMAKSHGLESEALMLMAKAVDAAKAAGPRSAELEMAVNLAFLQAPGQPYEAARDLRRLLTEARAAADDRLTGMILNNLAVIHAHLADFGTAMAYQDEALSVAIRIGDRAAETSRGYYLASIQERAGETEAAVRTYDRALTLGLEEGGLSAIGTNALDHVAKLVSEQYRDRTRATLAHHLEYFQNAPSEQDLQTIMQRVIVGQTAFLGSGPDAHGAVSAIPDNAFAGRLVGRKDWAALAVYAHAWIVAAGQADDTGYQWLAVALRGLGLPGAADAALSIHGKAAPAEQR